MLCHHLVILLLVQRLFDFFKPVLLLLPLPLLLIPTGAESGLLSTEGEIIADAEGSELRERFELEDNCCCTLLFFAMIKESRMGVTYTHNNNNNNTFMMRGNP
jgi:hypothetical protein